ncbi:MAG: PAS domain-containing protein [Candidatus Yonathbacteria bacterium]|nr:PAS domain-containing protein [Candidatus Yonathbacteria bacterium]
MRFYKKISTASGVAYIVLGFLFALVNLGWFIYFSRTLDGNIRDEEQHAAQKSAIAASTFLEMKKSNLEVIARALSDDLSDARNYNLVSGLLREKDYNRVFLAGFSGAELFVADRAHTVFPEEYVSVRLTDEFTTAISGQAAFGQVRITDRFEPVLTVVVPVVSSTGKIIGALGAELSAKSVFESIGTVTINGRGSAYVVDNTGVLIAHKDVSLVLKNTNFLNRLVVSETLKKSADVSTNANGGVYVYDNEDGISIRGAGAYVESARLAVIFEDPKNQAEQPLTIIRLLFGAVIGAVFLIIFILRKINVNLARTRTILEQERNKVSAILASIGEGLLVADREGAVVLSNKVAWNIIGPGVEEINGMNLFDVFPLFKNGVLISKEEHLATAVMKTGNPISSTLSDGISFRKKDGTDVPITMNATPLREVGLESEAVAGVIVTFRDATNEKRLQGELVSRTDEAERMNSFMVGRELKMVELKDKIALLEKEREDKIG